MPAGSVLRLRFLAKNTQAASEHERDPHECEVVVRSTSRYRYCTSSIFKIQLGQLLRSNYSTPAPLSYLFVLKVTCC